jgi:hypothetical protein
MLIVWGGMQSAPGPDRSRRLDRIEQMSSRPVAGREFDLSRPRYLQLAANVARAFGLPQDQ